MIIAPGATSQTITIQIVDDTGLAVTGLVAATFPTTYYQRAGEALPAAITLSDLASTSAAYSSGGVKEITGGYYRLDVPNAAFATASKVRIIGEASGKHIIYPPILCGVLRADNRDGDAIPTAAQNAAATRDVSNASPATGSLGAYVNEAAASATSSASYAASAVSGLTTVLSRIGSFTGSGVNTILGFLKAIASKSATLPSDIGGTFDPATDSLEAIADVGGGLTQQNIDDIAAGSAARVVATLGGVAGSASTDEVRPGGRLTIIRGDDYYAEDGFPISVVIENVENDLVVDSLTLYLYRAGVRVEESTTNITIAANVLTALVDMGRAKTSQLVAGDGRWSAQISLASGHYREPVTGPMLVTERVGLIP